MHRRQFIGHMACSALLLSTAPAVLAQGSKPISIAEAINKAGRQRMLSQRCAKAWLMRALSVTPSVADGLQSASIELFEAQLRELATLQPTDELRGLLTKLNSEWREYKQALSRTPGKDAAPEIYERSDIVLATAHATTQAYEKLSGTQFGRLINVSGRQRMLSQRLAKFVYFMELGVKRQEATEQFDKARKEFVEALALLKAAPENTEKLKEELALVEQQWFFFETALGDRGNPNSLKNIATTSERILEQLNIVVGLYERLMTA